MIFILVVLKIEKEQYAHEIFGRPTGGRRILELNLQLLNQILLKRQAVGSETLAPWTGRVD